MFGGQMHGQWGAGWFIGLFLLIVLIVGIVFFVIWILRQTQKSASSSQLIQHTSSPENILKERYARGEITRDEYLAILADLNE